MILGKKILFSHVDLKYVMNRPAPIMTPFDALFSFVLTETNFKLLQNAESDFEINVSTF